MIGLGVAVASLALATQAFAGTGDTVQANMGYYQSGYYFQANATQNQVNGLNASSWIQNTTPNGDSYQAQVKCAIVRPATKTAYIAAKVIQTNNPSFGPWVFIKLTDYGQPSNQPNGDTISAEFTTQVNALAKCQSMAQPTGGPWNLLNGDVRINNNPNATPNPS